MAKRLWTKIDGEPWFINPGRKRPAYLSPEYFRDRAQWKAERALARLEARQKRGGAGRRSNPIGEVVTIVGGLNPPRHRRRAVMARRRHHRRRRNHSRRRYRRNPPSSGGFAVMRPGTWMRPAVFAGGAALVSAWAPSVVVGTGVSSNQAYAVQFGTALLLGFGANWWGGPKDAIPAFSGAVAPIVADFTRRAIAGVSEASVPTTPATLSAYTSGRLGDLYYGRTFMPRGGRRVSAYPVPDPITRPWAVPR